VELVGGGDGGQLGASSREREGRIKQDIHVGILHRRIGITCSTHGDTPSACWYVLPGVPIAAELGSHADLSDLKGKHCSRAWGSSAQALNIDVQSIISIKD